MLYALTAFKNKFIVLNYPLYIAFKFFRNIFFFELKFGCKTLSFYYRVMYSAVKGKPFWKPFSAVKILQYCLTRVYQDSIIVAL